MRITGTCLLLLIACLTKGQDLLHRNMSFPFSIYHLSNIYQSGDSSFHSAYLPYYDEQIQEEEGLIEKLENRHLLEWGSEGTSTVGVSPFFQAAYQQRFFYGGGIRMEATHRNWLGASLTVAHRQAGTASGEDSLFASSVDLPEQGLFYPFGEETTVTGHLAVKPFKFLTLEAGKGRHFIGDGYRSMLLSNFAPAAPYVRVTTRFWKIQYTNLFTQLRHTDPVRYKYSATHHLSYNVTSWLNLGVFESIIFESRPQSGFDVQYLNPVIFYRPVEYSTGSADNALLGTNMKLTVFKKAVVYGQLLLDEFLLSEIQNDFKRNVLNDSVPEWGWWANKYGYQAGILLIDPLALPVKYNLRAEFNGARPFTYSHGSVFQSYSHEGYALAHPLGANFREGLFILEVAKGPFFGRIKQVFARYGADEGNFNFGGDILKSYNSRSDEFENFTTQGISTSIVHTQLSAGVVLHPQSGLNLRAGYEIKKIKNLYTNVNQGFVFIGLYSSLFNNHHDR